MKKIAVVEDDVYIGNMLAELLRANGDAVSRAYSGSEALLLLERETPDLMLLDLMLPGLPGEEVLSAAAKVCPVIILSAKTDAKGKAANLNAGAADYVTKPFDNDELLARVAVQLRRGAAPRTRLVAGDVEADLETYAVRAAGKSVRLTKTEFYILRALLEHPKKVYSKSALVDAIGEFVPDGGESSVSVHVSNLRKKLEEATGRNCIETVWGIGFKWAEGAERG